MTDPTETSETKLDFIREAVKDDLATNRFAPPIITRFPPEPNGYLHIGHAKAICISFGVANDYDGETNLRFDDTNPTKEEQEYIDAIREDVKWLGFDWARECYASDYFPQLYEWALQLIDRGLAYVDEQTPEEIRESRGNLTEPGKPSPYRDRPAEESRDLFARMKAGEFPDGSKVLRAKIDMASPNLNMRDPVLYRILHAHHPRTGNDWCIYPMYDYAHGQSDSIENITHSLCSLEFELHRPLYEWFIETLDIFPSRQLEFSRLNLTYMMTSKRKLKALVDEKIVTGWDDPRMPTLRGLRRRGYSAKAIRDLVAEVGITKFTGITHIELLEHHLRNDLNQTALRRTAVLNPLKVTITNWAEHHDGDADAIEMRLADNNPEDENAGQREMPMTGEIYIDRNDFMEDPPKKFFRLGPDKEVRLRFGYFIKCNEIIKDEAGEIVELHCTYDPATSGGQAPDGRKVKGTIHWVSGTQSIDAEVRLYDKLFTTEDPNEGGKENGDEEPPRDWRDNINPDSLVTVTQAKLEPALADAEVGQPLQFERVGYFVKDSDSTADQLIFNRTVSLKDSWAKMNKK